MLFDFIDRLIELTTTWTYGSPSRGYFLLGILTIVIWILLFSCIVGSALIITALIPDP